MLNQLDSVELSCENINVSLTEIYDNQEYFQNTKHRWFARGYYFRKGGTRNFEEEYWDGPNF